MTTEMYIHVHVGRQGGGKGVRKEESRENGDQNSILSHRELADLKRLH